MLPTVGHLDHVLIVYITDHAVEENHVIDWDKAKWSKERHSDRPDG